MKKVKYRYIVILSIILLLLITYLTGKNNKNKEYNKNEISEIPAIEEDNLLKDNENSGQVENKQNINNDITITNIKLEIYYKDNNVFAIYSDNIKNNTFIDESSNIRLDNIEAHNYIKERLLDINYNNPQSEVIDNIINNLNLNYDYINFNLNVLLSNKDNISISI